VVVVADASVAIRGDMSGFNNDLKGAQRETMTLGQKLNDLLSPKNLLKSGLAFGLGTSIPGMIRDVIGFTGDAIRSNSELIQSQRTVNDLFGDSAHIIRDWAEEAASSAGLSKVEVSESAAQMGQMLRNMGLDAGMAAEMIVDLQQRAADLATAHPGAGDAADALLAFSAALRGERDTVEKFGVTLTQSMIDARIETMKLDTSTPAAERYATAIATLGLIMDQTAPSADRFTEALDAGDSQAMLEAGQAHVDNLIAEIGGNANQFLANSKREIEDIQGVVQEIEGFFEHLNDPRFADLAVALGVTMGESREQVRMALQETGQDFDTTIDGMLMSAYELGEEGAESFDHFTAAFTQMALNTNAAASGVADVVANAIPAAILAHWDNIKQAGTDSVTAYAQGLLEAQNEPSTAFDVAMKLLEEEMTEEEEIAKLKGQLVTLNHAAGIASAEGKDATSAAIDSATQIIVDRLNQLGVDGYTYGRNLGLTFAAGIESTANFGGVVRTAAGKLAQAVQGQIGIRSEPKDPDSPLHGITKWGGNIVKTIAEGMTGELGTGQAAARALAGALVPSMGAAVGTTGSPTVMGAGSTYILQVNGQEKVVGSRDEVLAAWEQMTRASGEPV
jgi:hypothetical protein